MSHITNEVIVIAPKDPTDCTLPRGSTLLTTSREDWIGDDGDRRFAVMVTDDPKPTPWFFDTISKANPCREMMLDHTSIEECTLAQLKAQYLKPAVEAIDRHGPTGAELDAMPLSTNRAARRARQARVRKWG